MLSNLVIDLVANMTLVFVWKGAPNSEVVAILLGEDPITGLPFVFVVAQDRGLRQTASEAWDGLLASDLFTVQPAKSGLDSIQTVWGRAFGVGFSRAVEAAGPKQTQVSGVDLITWQEEVGAHLKR